MNASLGLCWGKDAQPEITVDLGVPQEIGAFRINVGGGYPWWDALSGEIQDEVEIFTSTDGAEYTSHGLVDMNLRWKDLPVNLMWPDNERLDAHLFELVLPEKVTARYVRYVITPQRLVCVNEVQVLDAIRYTPFDLRIALPDQYAPDGGEQPKVLTPAGRPVLKTSLTNAASEASPE